ncbi:MAG: recombinase family protein [Candidatus Margulisiibacteriota bacterium]
MLVGYARAITNEEATLVTQKAALRKAGCKQVFTDITSTPSSERKSLRIVLEFLREGDVLVVCKLDRLGRSLTHLIETIAELHQRHIGFRSLEEGIDLTSGEGKVFFHVFQTLSSVEKTLIKERTLKGRAAAIERGRLGGRPKALDTQTIEKAKALHAGGLAIRSICTQLGISKATLYRYLAL